MLNRKVDPGQTVAASLQSPVLFTIAENLQQMQVEISVDEADIGRVEEGQRIKFTVDSFPGRNFAGKVAQIRKASHEVSNVVTYTVVALAANPNLRLLPGMTANVEIVIGESENALRVPATALRFNPPGMPKGPVNKSGEPLSASERRRATGRARFAELRDELNLDEAQQERLKVIFRETGAAKRKIRAAGMAPDET